MSSVDVTYFCKYGRYFLIGSSLIEIDNHFLLVELAKTDIPFRRRIQSVDRPDTTRKFLV